MSQFATYYASIQETSKTLAQQFPGGFCLVISTSPINGGACEVSTLNASRLLVESTHRLTTDEETQVFREQQSGARARSAPALSLDAAREQFAAVMREKPNAR